MNGICKMRNLVASIVLTLVLFAIAAPLVGTKASELTGSFELINDADGKSGAIAAIVISATTDNN